MKKTFKILSIALMLTLVTGLVSVKAVDSGLGICVTGIEYSSYKTVATGNKTSWADQSITLDQVETSLTENCSSCVISFKLYDSSGGVYTGGTWTLGQTKSFKCSDGCLAPGTYNLKAARTDFTLLKTTIGFTWYYN